MTEIAARFRWSPSVSLDTEVNAMRLAPGAQKVGRELREEIGAWLRAADDARLFTAHAVLDTTTGQTALVRLLLPTWAGDYYVYAATSCGLFASCGMRLDEVITELVLQMAEGRGRSDTIASVHPKVLSALADCAPRGFA
jgi:hypothetical protein